MLRPTWIMDCSRKQTNQCAQYKLKKLQKLTEKTKNTKISIFFFKKIFFFFGGEGGSNGVVGTREKLFIDVSITSVGLILTKLGWFQHFSTSKSSISTFFEKKFKFLGFHVVILVKIFPLMYQLLLKDW